MRALFSRYPVPYPIGSAFEQIGLNFLSCSGGTAVATLAGMTSRADNDPTTTAPYHAARASRLWRVAVAVYVPALVLSVATAVLNWDAMVAATMSGGTGTVVPSEEEARTSVLVSVAFATAMQGIVALICWLLAGKLVQGSSAARMILSVAAMAFVINAVLSVIALATGANDVAPGVNRGAAEFIDGTVTVLIAAASAIAVWGTVHAYRGADNKAFFVNS